MADENESPLITWSKEQPRWQQHALKLLTKHGSAHAISEEGKNEIKKILYEEANGETPNFTPITVSDVPDANPTNPKTYLKSLGPVANIDKLASGQEPFEFVSPNGLTVIFGNNGSGKSGYAHILKNLCRSHGEVKPLRGDATLEGETEWQVNLTYAEKEQDSDETPKEVEWIRAEEHKAKNDQEYIPLERIAFFDSHVANTYVDGNRSLFYLPPEIRLYEELAILAGEFKEGIDTKTRELKSQRPSLPETIEGTSAHTTLSKLQSENIGNISQDEIDAICTLSAGEETELEKIRTKKTQTPEQQKEVIEAAKATLVNLNRDIGKISGAMSAESIQQLQESHKAYQDKKSLAEQGVAGLAKEMPIREGIGSDIWFEMFKAARTFAGSVYPEATPPAIANGEHCVLCHQDLTEEASERLKQFDNFMEDELQQKAEKAKKAFDDNTNAILSLPDLNGEVTKQQLQPYANLTDVKTQHYESIVSDVQLTSSRLTAIKTIIENDSFGDLESIRNEGFSLQADIDAAISEIDAEITQLESLIQQGTTELSTEDQRRFDELESKSLCNSQKNNIDRYYQTSQKIALLEKCSDKLNTRRISNQSKSRSAELYSDKLKRRYTSEVKKLGLSYLNIEVGNKADRGEQRVFVNVTGLGQTKKSEILSEGEQRAIALAGFLTEVNEVDIGNAIIFDDPVSSLDWDRRALIAERLAEEAKKRQVIIFTHDFSFALQLEKFAKNKNRGNSSPFFKQLWIAKQSIGTELQFGVTGETAAAWESKKVNQRLEVINSKISKLEKSGLVSDGSGTSEFDKHASDIARHLRQTWERAVEEVALNRTIERYSPNVMTKNLEIVQFDCLEDYQTLHEGMSVISKPAHDNPEYGGNEAPTLEQLKQNKKLLEEWVDNFKKNKEKLEINFRSPSVHSTPTRHRTPYPQPRHQSACLGRGRSAAGDAPQTSGCLISSDHRFK